MKIVFLTPKTVLFGKSGDKNISIHCIVLVLQDK